MSAWSPPPPKNFPYQVTIFPKPGYMVYTNMEGRIYKYRWMAWLASKLPFYSLWVQCDRHIEKVEEDRK